MQAKANPVVTLAKIVASPVLPVAAVIWTILVIVTEMFYGGVTGMGEPESAIARQEGNNVPG